MSHRLQGSTRCSSGGSSGGGWGPPRRRLLRRRSGAPSLPAAAPRWPRCPAQLLRQPGRAAADGRWPQGCWLAGGALPGRLQAARRTGSAQVATAAVRPSAAAAVNSGPAQRSWWLLVMSCVGWDSCAGLPSPSDHRRRCRHAAGDERSRRCRAPAPDQSGCTSKLIG